MKPKFKIATSIQYGNYKYLGKKAAVLQRIITKRWDEFTEMCDVHPRDGFKIVIRPVKGSTAGWHRGSQNCIEIDPRYSLSNVLKTFCHEMRHVWQHVTGKYEPGPKSGSWDGTYYRVTGSHSNYMNLPWEVDARSVEKDWRDAVFSEDIETYKHSWVDDEYFSKPQPTKTKRTTTKAAVNGFKIGDRVRFNNRTSTRYMRGVEGKIIGVKRTRVQVELTNGGHGRFENGRVVCPITILDKIS